MNKILRGLAIASMMATSFVAFAERQKLNDTEVVSALIFSYTGCEAIVSKTKKNLFKVDACGKEEIISFSQKTLNRVWKAMQDPGSETHLAKICPNQAAAIQRLAQGKKPQREMVYLNRSDWQTESAQLFLAKKTTPVQFQRTGATVSADNRWAIFGNIVSNWGSSLIGGYFYKEGQKARRPDVTSIANTLSSSASADANAETGPVDVDVNPGDVNVDVDVNPGDVVVNPGDVVINPGDVIIGTGPGGSEDDGDLTPGDNGNEDGDLNPRAGGG